MIKHLRIENFKRFDSASFPLADLTLFTGINGAGKSTVIQSLLLLRQSSKDKLARLAENVRMDGDLVDLRDASKALNIYANEPIIRISIDEDRMEDAVTFTVDASAPQTTPKCTVIGDLSRLLEISPLFGEGFCYLYADRVIPMSSYKRISASPTDSELGDRYGSNVAFRLFRALSDNENIKIDELSFESKSKLVVNNVSSWISYIVGGPQYRVSSTQESTDDVSIKYYVQKEDGSEQEMSPLNVAFGNTYILPIVLSVLLLDKGSLLIVENPEAHLHPAAQTRMGYFLSLAAQNGIQVILESHSDHLMNGIRLSVKEKKISSDKVEFFYLDVDHMGIPIIDRVIVEDNGELNRWPDGFFDEWEKSLCKLSE